MGSCRNSLKALSAAVLAVICGTAAEGYAAAPPASCEEPMPVKEEPEVHPEHKKLRKRGNQAAREARFGEAIEMWEASYALNPLYEVACAIGRAELLGRANALGAALWLTRCVNLAPIPERAKKDAAKELTAQQTEIGLRDLARARVGALRIVTDAEATIEVDGKSAGKAPLEDEVFVMPGAHRVVVTLGGRSRSVDLKLAAGEGRTVDLSFPAVPAMPERVASADKGSNEALFYTGMGVGTVGLGMTLGFGAAAILLRGEEAEAVETLLSNDGYLLCGTWPNKRECRLVKDTSSRADAFAAVSLISLSAAVAGGVMVAYAIFKPHPQLNDPKVQAAFIAAPGGGSLFLTGRF